jgi:hypothetical protein
MTGGVFREQVTFSAARRGPTLNSRRRCIWIPRAGKNVICLRGVRGAETMNAALLFFRFHDVLTTQHLHLHLRYKTPETILRKICLLPAFFPAL